MSINEKMTAIADAIREKTGDSEKLNLDGMALAIKNIEVGSGGVDLPEEAFNITGECAYRFAYGGWDWYIREFGKKIKTVDITNTDNMFYSSQLEDIPFEINFKQSTSTSRMNYMFYKAQKLKSIPRINGKPKPYEFSNVFGECYNIRYFPEDIDEWFDWSSIENQTSSYTGNMANIFSLCSSLRKMPIKIFSHANKKLYYGYSFFTGMCNSCYALDELVGLPIPYTEAFTSNAFSNTLMRANRLKRLTFDTPDGQPYVMKWKAQTLDVSYEVGYTSASTLILNYNSGITADKEVIDDATYQALKDDADWFTKKIEYSRYNHDSAVETINSLPDTSAYLATAGGTNTIKFKGASGSKTDGGAISTLTQEEIAVATAKGWTVSLV